jgi:sugar phosphate isomerase/epimerase
MISLISVNDKFKGVSAHDIVTKLVNSRFAKGVELCADPRDEEMMNYLDDFVHECKENNILFQIHGDSTLPLDIQKEYLDKLSKYSNYLEYPINVVLHTLPSETVEESLHSSQEYFGELLDHIDTNKIRLSIENLNDSVGKMRLDKHEMLPLMMNDERLYMTYDIGHDIADYGKITDLDEELVKRLSNIHLHEASMYHDEIGYDHRPINDEGENFERVLKGILYLKHIKYDGPVTFEYDLFYCDGNTIEERIDSYIYSIDDTSEHLQ